MSERDFSEISHSVEPKGWDKDEDVLKIANTVWNPNTLQWERQTVNTESASPSTSSVTQIGDSASSVTLSLSSTAWFGRTIYNDSSSLLRVKLGATASSTSFTVVLSGNASGIGGYYEVPFNYTGRIDGIWDTDAGGNAYITEMTS